jgi:SAM-dependent methyltransferase
MTVAAMPPDTKKVDTKSDPTPTAEMVSRYKRRQSPLYRIVRPPLPLVYNPREIILPQCEGLKLFVGGAGIVAPKSFVNVDVTPFAGVDVVADIEQLPFADGSVSAIECDAVLEHVRNPGDAIAECLRVLRPGGLLHVVVPFCHPFHGYPGDFQRWTLDGLKALLGDFEIVNVGVRTGPTATLLVFLLEYAKVVSPKPFRKLSYVLLGWILWPLRYLDVWLNRKPEAQMLANHIYALVRKPAPDRRKIRSSDLPPNGSAM